MSRLRITVAAAILMAAGTGWALAEESMGIVTYSTGLVVGELTVKVDLGPEAAPAELFLDGEHACSMSGQDLDCLVDLGPDPHVHLLELVRQDGARVERWLNRPGQEAELRLVVSPPSRGVCEARLQWFHPLRQDPATLEVALDGRLLKLIDAGHAARFPCLMDSKTSQALVASAVFPDGRRVEAVALVGGFSDHTDVGLTAVPLVATNLDGAPPCEARYEVWPVSADRIEQGGFEVVIVLDPDAAYQRLYTSGWHIGRLPTLDVTAKAGEKIFQKGTEDSEPKPRNSWRRAKTTIQDAERLWYVAPDSELHRVNGFAAGRTSWLELLFKFGMTNVPRPHRIADAVAASGLVAGAGPRRRVVVLVLGNNVHKRDDSDFTPAQAREYLAEVGVPLVVLRNGKPRDDGWPAGMASLDMEGMTRGLQAARAILNRQCIAWFAAELPPNRIAEVLPKDVRLAGRGEDAPSSPESVWARAEIETIARALGSGATDAAAERLDITAITVLVSAVDDDGIPVTDLAASDLSLLEDGTPVELLSLEPIVARREPPRTLGPPTTEGTRSAIAESEVPVSVYVDRTLGGGPSLGKAVRAVAGEADRLTALGPVKVVVSANKVETLLGPTRDAAQLAETLQELAAKTGGGNTIETIRSSFVRGFARYPDRNTRAEVEALHEEGAATIHQPEGFRVRFSALSAAREEHVALSRSLDSLRDWAAQQPRHRISLLLLVGSGFDMDPAPFYLSFVEQQEPHNVGRLRDDLEQLRRAESVNALGRQLAGAGWRVVSIAGDSLSTTGSVISADMDAGQKFQQFLSASTAGVRDPIPYLLLLDPTAPQQQLARPSGGDLVVGEAGLGSVLDSVTGWYRLTYQVARPPDSVIRTLELQSRRPGVEATTSLVVAAATSDSLAETRVRALLGDDPVFGELPVRLTLGRPAAGEGTAQRVRVDAIVDLASLAPAKSGHGVKFKISVGVGGEMSEPTIVHRQERLASVPTSGEWVYTFPVQWATRESVLAVAVEEQVSGAWGGAVIELPSF